MKLMNERNQVRGVAKAWRAKYGASTLAHHVKIGKKLDRLNDEVASAADVASIIGNDSWAYQHRCSECGTGTWDAVQVGEEPDYESETAYVCVDCLRKALALIGGVGQTGYSK